MLEQLESPDHLWTLDELKRKVDAVAGSPLRPIEEARRRLDHARFRFREPDAAGAARGRGRGRIAAKDLRERVANHIGLSESDLAEMLPRGRQSKFVNSIAWTLVHLQGAGLLKKATSGAYRVTDPGAEALTGQPKRIDICFLERYPAYVEWRRHIIELGQEAAQEARG